MLPYADKALRELQRKYRKFKRPLPNAQERTAPCFAGWQCAAQRLVRPLQQRSILDSHRLTQYTKRPFISAIHGVGQPCSGRHIPINQTRAVKDGIQESR